MSVADRIRAPGSKKILALDGGGIRGVVAIEVLARIEGLLRRALGRGPEFVLADYFDFIAGTSTGAIIATCIALGRKVADVRRLYLETGAQMFEKAFLLKRFRHKYEDDNLRAALQKEFGQDTRLGTDDLRTVLMVVMRNATTDSPWPVSNNPFAKYNQRSHPNCNLEIPLWQIVRASAAAPVYFPPEVVDLGGREFIFVDGGLTMYNNPAFQAFLMATLEPYKMAWQTGEDRLLLISVGTGSSPDANADLRPEEMNVMYNAASLPSALMFAASSEQDLLCRAFGACVAGDRIDREVGDLIGAAGPVTPRLFTYARYNAELTREGLERLDLADIRPQDVQPIDSLAHVAELQRVGEAVGAKVTRDHFESFLA